MTSLLQDVKFGARMLRKRPGFTAVAVLTLALGIGANTAIFSLVNAVLLRPLPYPEPERLVMLWEDAARIGFPKNTPAPANYVDWKSQTKSFEGVAATMWATFNLTGYGEPLKVNGHAVTADLFNVLGVRPALGRGFNADEEKTGSDRVVILSDGLWRDTFGGDPAIVGRDILMSGEKYTVVGVMPREFQYIEPDIRLWVPLALAPEDWANRDAHYLTVVGRLKDGVSVEQADADLKAVMARISRDHPAEAAELGAYVMPMREQVSGDVRRPLLMLVVVVAFVLLIACANVAGLLIARAAAGLLLALWSFAFLRQLVPPALAASTPLTVDARALVFTLAVSLLTATLFGLAPALQASKAGPADALKAGGGRGAVGGGGRTLRS